MAVWTLCFVLCVIVQGFVYGEPDPIDTPINPTLPSYKSLDKSVTYPPTRTNTSVCYRYLGCFDNYPPFDNTGGVLPSPPERVGTIFLLYTPTNKKIAQQIDYKDKGKSLKSSNFNSQFPTKFIIHGFTQNEKEEWLHDMKDALMTLGPMNVFIVGWGEGAAMPDYPRAVANTRVVAKQTELMIKLLNQQGMDYARIHLIGHSLGAHISGYAGADLDGQIGRISGMDPAGPSFEGRDDTVRLNPSDAQFVDIIHSNAAPLVDAGAGILTASGHVDFYPNGGRFQPGCPGLISGGLKAILAGKFGTIGDIASCSHGRSHQLYIESIPNKHGCALLAQYCKSWKDYEAGKCKTCGERGCSELGYHSIEYTARGSMYLLTKGFPTADAPDGEEFCGIAYNVLVSPSKDADNVHGAISLTIKGSKSSIDASFQGDGDTLHGDSKVIIVDYEDLGNLNEVVITYKHHQAWFFGLGSGVEKWKLERIVISHGGKTWKFCSTTPIKVTTSIPVKLGLC